MKGWYKNTMSENRYYSSESLNEAVGVIDKISVESYLKGYKDGAHDIMEEAKKLMFKRNEVSNTDTFTDFSVGDTVIKDVTINESGE